MRSKVILGLLVVSLATNSAYAKPKDTLGECQKREKVYQEKLENLNNELEKAFEAQFSAESELFMVRESLASAQMDLKNMTSNFDILSSQYQELSDKYQILEQDNSEKGIVIADLTSQVENLSLQNSELVNTVQVLSEVNSSYKTSYEELLAKYAQTATDHADLNQRYEQMVTAQTNLQSQIDNYISIVSPEVPYVITGNFECISTAKELLNKFIKKASGQQGYRLRISRKVRKMLEHCQSTEMANETVLTTLKNSGINIK